MTATLRSMRIDRECSRCFYGSIRYKYDSRRKLRSETVDNSWDNRTQFVVNRESSWCQRFQDWLRSVTNSREYSYGVSTNKHDSATVALRIRPRPITTTIRHECFKQFKTSVALPWSFPKHHHDSPWFYYETPLYTTILQIAANRSGIVAKNRECVNKQALRQ